MQHPKYSVIVPVYNRPEEVNELLHSLTVQQYRNFEVIIVEDGSTNPCRDIVDNYRDKLQLEYIFKQNSGPGPSRNVGYAQAKGDYFVVFDSDCIIPPDYFKIVDDALSRQPFDAWGGPDRAHENFTPLQRAMAFTMSSVLTTGGIRGKKNSVGSFQPRSFNMGISRNVYDKTQGFSFSRLAEDIELSIRMRKLGFNVVLLAEAFVFHKRRTTLRQFYHQVSSFGKGRVQVGKAHPGEVKLTHWFPALFLVGMFSPLIVLPFSLPLAIAALAGYVLYFLAIFLDAYRVNNSLYVAALSIPAAFIQLTGYGSGFLKQIFSKA
ncbi:MAG: glycosyltransferase [Cyclobacteriaceae bacterium]|nr:glycosyltransferase [Cyclobacteriaceae bacterium]